jgi:exosortase J
MISRRTQAEGDERKGRFFVSGSGRDRDGIGAGIHPDGRGSPGAVVRHRRFGSGRLPRHLSRAGRSLDPLDDRSPAIPLVSIALTFRMWRQHGWELRGTWWGLLVIAFSFLLSLLRQNFALLAVAGMTRLSFIPTSLPVYVYGSGVVLLFAGTRVWRRAWFPLGLLLLCQPVPILVNGLIDIPLQNVSAKVARSFATLIGFAPTTPQLRLMFSPNFGMFIAPGCDGIRGAVTMGYVALVLGYLKRASVYRWAAYVSGAVLLGYLFNFIRLCVLVVYYRIALGHSVLEGMAKWADYGIGSCLFLVATLLFIRLALSMQQNPSLPETTLEPSGSAPQTRNVLLKCAGLAFVLLLVLSLPFSALKYSQKATPTPEALASRMPRKIGDFTLTRTWYEQENGSIVLESGTYSGPGVGEIILGVWVAPLFHLHDPNDCWLARGLNADILTTRSFVTAEGKPIPLSTGFYNDGITDSIVVNAICTPASCSHFQDIAPGRRFGFLFVRPQNDELIGSGSHPVSIMLRIDKLHSESPSAVTYSQLSDEAQRFLSGLDMPSLSRAFQ